MSKGVYVESVTIPVGNLELVGKKAVIDAHFDGNCITVDATGVSISGFALVNGQRGIAGNQPGLVVSKCTIATCAGKGNGRGQGPDIAGAGDGGSGSVSAFEGNKFQTGAEDATSLMDNYGNTSR